MAQLFDIFHRVSCGFKDHYDRAPLTTVYNENSLINFSNLQITGSYLELNYWNFYRCFQLTHICARQYFGAFTYTGRF